MSEAAGVTQAQLDVARRIAAGGFIVVAGCDQGFARVQCRRRLSLFETDAAFIELAKRAPHARAGSAALVGASTNGTSALYLGTKRSDISAIVADSGVGLDYPMVPVLILATHNDGVLADIVKQAQVFESALRARGTVVESHYYDDGAHVVLVAPATSDDAVRRTIAFLEAYTRR
jgi:dienelactone hydrolase